MKKIKIIFDETLKEETIVRDEIITIQVPIDELACGVDKSIDFSKQYEADRF